MGKEEFNEKDVFIEKVLIPSFIGLVDKNIYKIVYDISGKIIFATNNAAKSLGFDNWLQIKNKKLSELSTKNEELFKEIEHIRELVINKQQVIDYLYFAEFSKNFDVQLVSHAPIFMPNGEVLGSSSTSTRFWLFNLKHLFNRLYKKSLVSEEDEIHLSNRQEEILFLIMIGFSQREIAVFLKISRGTVAKIIAQDICPKFKINGSSTKLLIEKALNLNYPKRIPNFNLVKPQIIIINHLFK